MPPVSDQDRIAAAQAYIDALVSHDASAVPFTPDCVRIELGMKTGFSGDQLRRSLDRGPQFRVISACTPPQYTIAGDVIRAVYTVLTKASIAGRRISTRVDETFVIPADDPAGQARIHHIRARIRPIFTHDRSGYAEK
ncbi:MAG: hypothetical protein K2Q25_00615 [Mycobacteriaceae bacterium]|nr:hypothetical protein [Mycobacteriaceae bacterium]